MALDPLYARALEDNQWDVPQNYDALFNWNYSDDRKDLLNLYRKGKSSQWDAESRIDWSQELDPDDPLGIPIELFPLYGADFFMKMSKKEQSEARRHQAAWSNSQFLHGEQGALLCAAKIVQNVPDSEAKFYASTQVIDEARHVESYKMLLEKIGLAYPITGPLKSLLDQVLRDKRWDMTYLGMQVVIEGLALAAFANIRDNAKNPLAAAVNAYVMQDEARHVAFGRLTLRDYYPELTQAERNEREEFLIEACYLMRDRFTSTELWETLDYPVKECEYYLEHSEGMKMFRTGLFSRIVPVVKDIGLWGDKIQKAYGDMGILGFANIDIDAMQANDMKVADEHDARRAHVEEAIEAGKNAAE
ncbi:ferritin-like domain-containing protein [Kordiimonas marina]|uniref:ferritin-like domain-containing protein n=1 Tax=Kordiimonas marina TaxID=2872312 RepID=UPI001FF637B3|nr:ferritin-like domain-containing protein [Kordiimonas marina]MCJ9428885.1 ferritin-like domain-containing protein [Kordiimonas marina]